MHNRYRDGQCCGRLSNEGVPEYNKNFYTHGIHNPLEQEPCQNCSYLPLCFGECTYDRSHGYPCTFASLTDECWSGYVNAYVLKRMLKSLGIKGFSAREENGTGMENLIMGRFDDRYAKFISNAQSVYLLGDLTALAEKNGIVLNSGDSELLLQLIQPTELSI